MPAKKTSSSTALAAVLPGEAAVDQKLLDEAVQALNRIYAAKGLETAKAVGEHVLGTFFGNDPDNFRRRGKEHLSFRALSEREDLRVSYSFIYNTAAVVDQLRLLPSELATVLPFTHQKLLLPVKDEKAKVNLARKAVEKELTTRALAAEVRRIKEKGRDGSRAGRPVLPAFVKALGRLKAVREQALSEEITAETFATYSPDKAEALLVEVEDHIAALQETARQVRSAREEWQRRMNEIARP